MFSDKEVEILDRMRGYDATAYPFHVTDDELEKVFSAIKRERGDAERQARRKVRKFIADKFDWTFAMDGGFMPKKGAGSSGKYWQDSEDPFSKVYKLYENLVLGLMDKGLSLETIDEIAKNQKFPVGTVLRQLDGEE